MSLFRKKRIFLDYASATPVLPEVKRAMEKYWQKEFYNPNAIYAEGERIKVEVEMYREKIAKLVGARSESVYFTSGGTEANALAIKGVGPGRVVVEPGSHPSIVEIARGRSSGKVVLVSSPVPDNKIGRKIREKRKKSNSDFPLLHIDASQSALYFDVGLERLACDLMTLDASKLYGPKGIGALVVRRGVDIELPPLGTPAVPLIAGFAKALEIAERDRETEFKRLESLSGEFFEELKRNLPEAEIERTLPNIVNISVPGVLPEMIVLALDSAGVMVSAGPACTSNKPEPPETPVRFSFGRFTTRSEVERALKMFCHILDYGKIKE